MKTWDATGNATSAVAIPTDLTNLALETVVEQKFEVAPADGRAEWSFVGKKSGSERVVVRRTVGSESVASKPFIVPQSERWVQYFDVSPDGALFAATIDSEVEIIDTASGRLLTLLPITCYGGLTFSPDGKWLATLGNDLDVWDVATGKRRWPDTSAGVRSAGRPAAWSADGTTLITTSNEGPLRAWDADNGARRWLAECPKHYAAGVRITGREVRAFLQPQHGSKCTKPELRSWHAATGKPLRAVRLDEVPTTRDDFYHEPEVAFRPDAAFATEYAGGKLTISAYDAMTGRRRVVWAEAEVTGRSLDGVFSPDGRYGVWYGPLVWRLSDGRAMPPFDTDPVADTHTHYSAAWSADGALIAMVLVMPAMNNFFGDTAFRVWERATGRMVASWGEERDNEATVTWSPDGRSVLATMRGSWGSKEASQRIDIAAGTTTTVVGDLPEWAERHRLWSPDRTRYATAADDGTVLIWPARPRPKPAARPSADADAAWAALAGEDAAAAWRAVWVLVDAEAVGVLRRAKRVEVPAGRLIADLDAKEFRVREAASRALREAGDGAADMLRTALTKSPSAEAKARIEERLAPLAADKAPTGETVPRPADRGRAGADRVGRGGGGAEGLGRRG